LRIIRGEGAPQVKLWEEGQTETRLHRQVLEVSQCRRGQTLRLCFGVNERGIRLTAGHASQANFADGLQVFGDHRLGSPESIQPLHRHPVPDVGFFDVTPKLKQS